MSTQAGAQAEIQRALLAIEQDDIETAKAVAAQLAESLGDTDPRVMHLQGMCAWAEGELGLAASSLLSAADAGPQEPQIYLDCAEFHLAMGHDLDTAEATLRALIGREGVEVGAADEARIMLAQCRLEHSDADAEEAIEILDQLSEAAGASAMARSTRSAALLDLGRGEEAIEILESVAAEEVDDDAADLHYQLGICYAMAGREDDSNASMIRVRDLDALEDEYAELDDEERGGLRGILDELLEDLPEPLLKRVAGAAVRVQTRASDAQIRGGIDPRAFIGFDGEADSETLEAIVVMRNPLLDALDHESQLPEALIEAMIDEFRRFFGLEDVSASTN